MHIDNVFARITHSLELVTELRERTAGSEGKKRPITQANTLKHPTIRLDYFVIEGFMGHFNHANLRVSIGPLRYVLNSPGMHIWHHTHPESGPIDRNFGIIFSVWDWLFRTAYMPAANPRRLGFADMERFPRAMWRQLLVPLSAR